MFIITLAILVIVFGAFAWRLFSAEEPLYSGRVPTSRILRRRGVLEVYGMVHFGIDTFMDQKRCSGGESAECFNPSEMDVDEIVRSCRDGGLSGLIIVCKHHDGFCLWPTKTTEYNISASPYKGGKGDLVKEFADACRKYGMGVGFYVSPWDRNNAAFGKPEYTEIYREQLREICTNYGQAFELWIDGANGGEGYYGGANEMRRIDHSVYYDWPNTWKMMRRLQPNACIFSDVGPDLRCSGSENGCVSDECYGNIHLLPAESNTTPAPGLMDYSKSAEGMADGELFLPPECDFPLRPNWFYHPCDDGRQKSVDELVDIYMHSVGCGGFMNVGISPDRRGRLDSGDIERLKEFRVAVETLFQNGITATPLIEVTPDRPLVVEFGEARTVVLVDMREELAIQGEVVNGYVLEARVDGEWKTQFKGQAIGLRRLRRLPAVHCDALRIVLATETRKPVMLQLAAYGEA
ncbi:MAG: alpha-L-fucosidase [Lentisphaeria bacterium]|nr:alpha-L-fucosidase [Lentisphaeria bacterium]